MALHRTQMLPQYDGRSGMISTRNNHSIFHLVV